MVGRTEGERVSADLPRPSGNQNESAGRILDQIHRTEAQGGVEKDLEMIQTQGVGGGAKEQVEEGILGRGSA